MVEGERKKALPARRVTVKVYLTANGNTGRWFQFTIRPDGTHPLRLTNDTIEDLSPCYSPNGGRIAFTSQGRDGFDRDVFAMSSGGSNIVNLTPNDLFDDRPDWQPVTRPL